MNREDIEQAIVAAHRAGDEASAVKMASLLGSTKEAGPAAPGSAAGAPKGGNAAGDSGFLGDAFQSVTKGALKASQLLPDTAVSAENLGIAAYGAARDWDDMPPATPRTSRPHDDRDGASGRRPAVDAQPARLAAIATALIAMEMFLMRDTARPPNKVRRIAGTP